MKKGKIVVAAVLCLLLGLAAYFGPGIYRTVHVYMLAEAFWNQPEQSLDVTVMTGGSPNVNFRLDWQDRDGKRIFLLESGGQTLSFCEGVIYLQNGKGYRFSEAMPDLTPILEKPWLLLPLVQIQQEEAHWRITAAVQEFFPEFRECNVIVEDGSEGVRAVYLDASAETAYLALRGVCREDRPVMEVPDGVLAAIEAGLVQGNKDLTQDVLRLFRGWARLNQADPLQTRMDIRVNLLELPLHTQLTLTSTRAYGAPIHYLNKGDMGFYFSEGAACTSDGTIIGTPESSMDLAKLPGLAYYLCFNGDLSCEGDSYRLELDQEGMSQVLYAIAPETKQMALTLTGGALELNMEGDSIASISIRLDGQVDLVITQVQIGAEVEMGFYWDGIEMEVSEQVVRALQE